LLPCFHPKQLKANDLTICLRPKREGNLVALLTLVNGFFELAQKKIAQTGLFMFTQA
jgi:hypothetical protein